MSAFAHRPRRGATDSWLTPPELVGAVGPFDLDPCAAGAEYAWRPWETAATSYTHDGLTRPWFGMVWVNPPFGDEIGPWLARAAAHGRAVGLAFARTETDWFFDEAWDKASGWLFLRGRLHFHKPSGERARDNCGAPPVLIGYGDEAMMRLARSGIPGKLLPNAFAVLVTPDGARVGTWKEVIEAAAAGRTLALRDLYAAAEGTAKVREAKARGHNWRAQVRRALQRYFAPVGGGVWRTA